jgi:hypothetical protein
MPTIGPKDSATNFTLEGWLKLAEQDAIEELEPTPMRLVDLLDRRSAW